MFTKRSISRLCSFYLSVVMALLVLIASAALPANVRALGPTITVNNELDNTISGNTYCTLREAINNANANSDTTGGDCIAGDAGNSDTIVFSNLLVVHTVTLGSALPTISDPAGLTINGDDSFTVSGNDFVRVFSVGSGASLTLDSLTVTHGKVVFGVSGVGGGAYNGGTLTITNCLFSNNTSEGGVGGGVVNFGILTVANSSIFSGNTATYVSGSSGYGGGIYNGSGNTANITSAIFSGNSADIRGGGIYNYLGTTSITDSTFSSNSMSSPGDGGGGIYNDQGTLTITNSTFSGNTANSNGSNGGGIFNNQGMTNISLSTFSNDSVTTGGGGGIASNGTLNVANSTFSSNYADLGAGIYNGIGGTLTSSNNTFSGNTTLFTAVSGGGIYNEGALYLYNTILANTISGGDCFNSIATGTVSGNNNLIEDALSNACGLTNGISGNIIGSDPNLGAATLLNPIYFPLNSGSPSIEAGDNAICAVSPVSSTSQNGIARPQGLQCDIGSYELPISVMTFNSLGGQDGWVLESTETSKAGGTMNSTATTFNLGDETGDRQYRGILHFNTAALPDTPINITSITLRIKKQGQIGTNPFSILGPVRVDIRTPSFGLPALAIGDFQAAASQLAWASFGSTPVSNWYSSVIKTANFSFVSRTGTTQFRLRFNKDDNDDNGADYMKFYSGNAAASVRPQLIVQYYVP